MTGEVGEWIPLAKIKLKNETGRGCVGGRGLELCSAFGVWLDEMSVAIEGIKTKGKNNLLLSFW